MTLVKGNARRLRRSITDDEKSLWRVLRAGRFAGFKFRRQYSCGNYVLDFYCPLARLAVELDGFQHGLPMQLEHDTERDKNLADHGIVVMRFWNRQWRSQREGVLLEIWGQLNERTGCVKVVRKTQNHRFLPPDPEKLIRTKTAWKMEKAQHHLSPPLSPNKIGGEEAKNDAFNLTSYRIISI